MEAVVPKLRFLLAGYLALAAVSPAFADPIAFLVGAKGSVHVTRAGSKTSQPAALGRPLERGDRVEVGVAGSASIFFSDGNIIELGERSSVTVGGKVGTSSATTMGPGADVPKEVFVRVSRFIKGESKQTSMIALAPMRGGVEDGAPLLLSPRRTAVRTTRPEFRWREANGATRYRVAISGDEGEIWNLEATGTSIEYPTSLEPLAAGGQYLVELTAFGGSGRIRTEESAFSVMAESESRLVETHLSSISKAVGETDSEAGHYLAGSYLVGQGLYHDAIPHFEALCRLEPQSPEVHEALGSVYRTVGLTDLAATEFQKALELTKNTP